jgi:hypothetical protein
MQEMGSEYGRGRGAGRNGCFRARRAIGVDVLRSSFLG